MKLKLLFLLNFLFLVSFAKVDNQFLAPQKVKDLRESFKPILEVPSKFLKFRSLWYEGNNRQQMSNILAREKIKQADLRRLIDLLNLEEKRLGYKATVIADAVNGVIMKKFLRELSHLMPVGQVEKEARAKFINPSHLVAEEKLRHKKIIQDQILPLMKTLPVNSNNLR